MTRSRPTAKRIPAAILAAATLSFSSIGTTPAQSDVRATDIHGQSAPSSIAAGHILLADNDSDDNDRRDHGRDSGDNSDAMPHDQDDDQDRGDNARDDDENDRTRVPHNGDDEDEDDNH